MEKTSNILGFLKQNKQFLFVPLFYGLFFVFKDSFIYKSYFFFGSFIMFVACCIFLSGFYKQKNQSFQINLPLIISIFLLIIPFLTLLITKTIGFEVAFYYLCVFALFMVFYFRQNYININNINKLIITFALCESIFCVLQFLNFLLSSELLTWRKIDCRKFHHIIF